MAQISSDYVAFAPANRLLQKQGMGSRTSKVQFKFLGRWAIWILIITVLALFYVWSRVQVVQLGYEISKMQADESDLAKQASSLEVELAKLKSPARLEEIAKKELGLQHPTAAQTVLVKPEEVTSTK